MLFAFLKRLFLSFAPLMFFYLLRRKRPGKKNNKNPPVSQIDKSKVVEGEIVE